MGGDHFSKAYGTKAMLFSSVCRHLCILIHANQRKLGYRRASIELQLLQLHRKMFTTEVPAVADGPGLVNVEHPLTFFFLRKQRNCTCADLTASAPHLTLVMHFGRAS